MFGMPSLQNIMLIAVAPILIACAVVNWRMTAINVAAFFGILIADILVLSGYFPFMYLKRDKS